mgnify:CR=1 FL=1
MRKQPTNGEIKIEKGVPVSSSLTFPDSPRAYPWRQMEVGDSFKVAGVDANTVASAANQFQKRARGKCKFTVRLVDGGVRCWRIA